MSKGPILLVDDESTILFSLSRDIRAQGFEVILADSGDAAMPLLRERQFDIVITDMMMEGANGLDVLKAAKALHPETLVIIMTGHSAIGTAVEALRLGAHDYLIKPCDRNELRLRIVSYFEFIDLQRQIQVYENILPVCCVCKKIRNDAGKQPGAGKWTDVETYVATVAGAQVTALCCPQCAATRRPSGT